MRRWWRCAVVAVAVAVGGVELCDLPPTEDGRDTLSRPVRRTRSSVLCDMQDNFAAAFPSA